MKFRRFFSGVIIFVVAACSIPVIAQKAGSGLAGGAGKVYDAAGKSAAVRELQQKMNTGLLRTAISRASGAKTRSTQPKTSIPSKNSAGRPSQITLLPPSSQPVFTDFTPTRNDDFATTFAESVGSNPTEREFVKQLVITTKDAFEKEVAAKGRKNNLAAALTFFVATTVMVYHDDPEPSDEAVDTLWDGLNDTLNDLPALAAMSDAEKQEMYDTLVALSGLVLVGHMSSSQTGDVATKRLYKELAGALIETVLKTEASKLRFGAKGLNVSN